MDQVVKRSPNSQAPTPVASVARRVRRPKFVAKIAILVVIVLVLVGGLYTLQSAKSGFAKAISKDKYQAVFLTNGQVYFGKIDSINAAGYTLKDIYYLQVQQDVQGEKSKTPDGKDQNLSLAKLGSELHGPDDTMYIEGKQVLFWENLKNDSQVVKAIDANKKK